MSAAVREREVEELTQKLGHEMFGRMRGSTPGVFQYAWWQERLLQLCMQDEWFKVQAFRFIDVLPMMQTDAEVARHLKEYFVLPEHARNGQRSAPREHALPGDTPAAAQHAATVEHAAAAAAREAALRELEPAPFMQHIVKLVSRATNFRRLDSIWARLLALGARRGSMIMAGSFIAGANIDEAVRVIRRLRRRKMAFTIDVLGEAALSAAEGAAYHQTYMDLVGRLPGHAATWPAVPLADEGNGQVVPRVNVSVKLTSLYPGFDPIAPEAVERRAKELLRSIFRKAMEGGVHIHIDMEHYAIKDLTLDVFEELLLEPEFRDYPHFGIVLQAYLKDGERDGQRLIAFAKRRGTPLWCRLVKGAYWDSETVWAAQRHWPVPVWEQKWQSDACYERMTRTLLADYRHVRCAFASHNVRSLAHAMAVRELYEVPTWAFELQMLYGMGDPIKQAAVQMGQRCRIYTPYGNLLAGMAYLIRRLLENTANESFLRHTAADDASEDELLCDPQVTGRKAPPASRPVVIRYEFEEPIMDPFENVANTDFALEASRQKMQAGLAGVRAELGREYPVLLGGQAVRTSQWFESRSPSWPKEIVARVAQADEATANRAVEAAQQAWKSWRNVAPDERAAYVTRVGEFVQHKRFELAALMALECGKTWREADADVSEAIDYCVYYAKEMVRISGHPRRRDIEGETNEYSYQPRGVVAVIGPWNFPLALLANMTAAAVVTGNTVVMKPASSAAAVAGKFMELCAAAGLPAGVVNYVPGPGATVGEALVRHPQVAAIAFTGSRAVGQRINKLAAESPTARPGLKRVIAELGAKNAVIVDSDADLDEAIKGVIASAFAYAGQKCSAASRVIVLDAIHDRFTERLVEAARSKGVGPADDPATAIPPVIDRAAFDAVREWIEVGKREGRCVLAVDTSAICAETGGYYIGPHIFTDVPPTARIAREEIFGPVLTVIRVRDFDEAIAVFNGTDYALTGGIFSRSPANLERARAECECGNFYVNRPIAGSRVDLQPFGGLKLSGDGARTGGPDYLIQYCQPRTITENTLRRGFAPSEEVAEALG
jgi:RHH-type proline utilization regulon transcriptional repressor/proline dehydrogenase/delta 1-pyrroline-5-carboxylate dehydrogenase